MNVWVELMGHHTPSNAEDKSAPVFYPSTYGTSLECYVASMDIIPLFDCLCNVRSTSPMYILINWEGCQHLYGWLEIMLHHTSSKVEDTSVSVFIHLSMVHPSGVVWPVWMISPCLVGCTMGDQPHTYIDWWIERGANTCMDDWSSWYTTQHPRQEQEMYQFSSIHPCHILVVLCG